MPRRLKRFQGTMGAGPVNPAIPGPIPNAPGYPVGGGTIEWPDAAIAAGGGSDLEDDAVYRSLASWIDAGSRYLDDRGVNLMLAEPAIMAPLSVLALRLVEHEFRLLPNPRTAAPKGYAGGNPEIDARVVLANEVIAFNRQALDNLARPIEDVLLEMALYPAFGAELAEIVMEVVDGVPLGVGAGYSLAEIRPIPRGSWQFVADEMGKVTGFLGARPQSEGGGWAAVPAWKCCYLNWWPRPGDPRGTKLIRPARPAWLSKTRHVPDHSRWLGRFGMPLVVGNVGSSLRSDVEPSPPPAGGVTELRALGSASGAPGKVRARMFQALSAFRAGGIIVLRGDESVHLVEPTTDANSLIESFKHWDRQMVMAIIGNPRSILEAERNSKADSETSERQLESLVTTMRRAACRMVSWSVLWRLNYANFGREIADLYTPTATLDRISDREYAGLVDAWSRAGWSPAPEHAPIIDAMLDLPARRERPGADAAPPGPREGPGDESDN